MSGKILFLIGILFLLLFLNDCTWHPPLSEQDVLSFVNQDIVSIDSLYQKDNWIHFVGKDSLNNIYEIRIRADEKTQADILNWRY